MRSRELLLSLLERAVNLVPFRDEYIQPGRAATLDPAAYENIYTHTHTKQLYTCVYTCTDINGARPWAAELVAVMEACELEWENTNQDEGCSVSEFLVEGLGG